jgi:hypothetical protein
VAGNDYTTPGVRYWLPAPYLLVKAPVEISRSETLYSLSPIEKTILRPVVPCDESQAGCGPTVGGGATAHPGSLPGEQSGHRPEAAGEPREHHHEDSGPPAIIVWLPDYCQQYTIHEKDHSGSQKVQIQLVEGWKLNALNTENNNTEVLQKMFDTISSLAGTVADSSRRTTSVLGTGAHALVGGSGAQSAQTRLFRRTRTLTFKPGLYPLLEYPRTKENEPDCTRLPSFHPPTDATQQNELWSEVASPNPTAAAVGDGVGSVQAAPVDPGRPAAVARPPLR